MPTDKSKGAESSVKQTKGRPRDSLGTQREKPDGKNPPTKRAKKAVTGTASSSNGSVPSYSHTLIIDNGGDTLKYGWLTDEGPRLLPNVTARLAHQITLLVGDELEQVQNPSSLVAVTRSCERGIICNMGNQTQVWKRVLDLLGVLIPLQSEAAGALGWKGTKNTKMPNKTIPSNSVAAILLLPPHYPRTLIDQITYVWMEDFGVACVGFANSSVLAAQEHPQYKTCCTVDLGWSSSLVVPTFRKQIILPEAIRRLPIGGRHLVNVLKYFMSYRQYNLMDQEHLLTDVLQQLSYVSLEFRKDLALARRKPSGRRLYDRDFLLPDYQTRIRGEVRIPPPLQAELNAAATKNIDENEDEDEDDAEDYEMDENDEDGDDNSDDGEAQEIQADVADHDDDDGEDDDDEEESTIEQRRQLLLRQRAEEERRRREQAEEEQVLRLSVERFTIPEILFHPSDAGFPGELVGLGPAVVQAIQACPEHFHAALYQSIHLVGGVSRIQNMQARLENEVRELASSDYTVHVSLDDRPVDRGWLGTKAWLSQCSHMGSMISRDEWLLAGKRKAYTRLLWTNGGACV